MIKHLDDASTAYGMQNSAGKTKLMTNTTNGISTGIAIDDKKLETVNGFKYLGDIVSDEGPKLGLLYRTAQTAAAVTKLKVIWNDKSIATGFKVRLMLSLVIFFISSFVCMWNVDLNSRH